jgi:hypothetical protein
MNRGAEPRLTSRGGPRGFPSWRMKPAPVQRLPRSRASHAVYVSQPKTVAAIIAKAAFLQDQIQLITWAAAWSVGGSIRPERYQLM